MLQVSWLVMGPFTLRKRAAQRLGQHLQDLSGVENTHRCTFVHVPSLILWRISGFPCTLFPRCPRYVSICTAAYLPVGPDQGLLKMPGQGRPDVYRDALARGTSLGERCASLAHLGGVQVRAPRLRSDHRQH